MLRRSPRSVNGRLCAAALIALGLCDYALAAGAHGRVVDAQGQPVGKALVRINDSSIVTGDDGRFRLEVKDDKRYILNISHPDYADAVHIFRRAPMGQIWVLARAQVETVDARLTIRLQDKRRELRQASMVGATFSLAPNSLVDEQGRAPIGLVRAAIATLNLANAEGPTDWGVRSANGREGFLVSYGAVHIQFSDPSGKTKYQLKGGRSGRLELPVIPSMRQHAAKAPSMPLWYFDAAQGLWKGAGKSRYDRASGRYVGDVKHLSTINTDIAKFGDAACLRVTLDPSVPTGLKLRLRYHSGGTAFGQVPSFVMSDAVNAAYRLPANTNVQLELLNAADEAFGNLVVEDPAGSALVNTVVNTGPPIPPGGTLWPPAPYASCKPIVLRLATPEVEVRINEHLDAVLAKDNPSDDYLTWAPTYALVRLTTLMAAAVDVVLTNDAPGTGGDLKFAAHAEPWPVNTTATADTLTLSLPGDGSWVQFMVAGRHGMPSINDKDAILEAHLSTAAGPLMGRKAMMVRVRKDANTLSAAERSRFLFAWRAFRNQLGANYVRFQEMHRLVSTAGDEGHSQPAFLTWHRAMLLDVERELQKIDPSVGLHYWNWDAAAPNVFSENFMGAPNTAGGFLGEPVFAPTNPLRGWNTDLPFSGGELRRNTNDHRLAPAAGVFMPLDHPVDPDLVAATNYGPYTNTSTFSTRVERYSHDTAHGWPCGGGHVTAPVRSAADPLFYLLHSNIDRQWAYWQRARDRYGVSAGGALTFPAPAHYDNNGTWNAPGVTTWQKGSFLEDGMWPWDGTSGGTPGARDERPVNQATAPGTNIPVSMPMVPMTQFPASARRNLWPLAAVTPRSRDTIDYMGRFRIQDGLGFSYDDVPY
jgi:tyrosinase